MIARAMRFIDMPAVQAKTPLATSPPQGGRGQVVRFFDAAVSFFPSPLVGEDGRGVAGAGLNAERPADASQQGATS